MTHKKGGKTCRFSLNFRLYSPRQLCKGSYYIFAFLRTGLVEVDIVRSCKLKGRNEERMSYIDEISDKIKYIEKITQTLKG